ncbi:MAG: S8 family peptidase [Planctomycetota bacterium]|jgi:subtilisin family serine protease
MAPFGRGLQLEPLEDRCLLAVAGLPAAVDFSQLTVDPDSYDPSAILVRFHQDAPLHRKDVGLLGPEAVGGTEIGAELPLVPGLRKVQLQEGVSVDVALAAYRSNPQVLYAEPDYEIRLAVTPDDIHFDLLWGLHNTGQTDGTADADVDAPEAWDTSVGSGQTVVAVIDTGVDYNHPDLAANMWQNTAELNGQPNHDDDGNGYVDDVYGYDFANNDGDPWDDHNHGTHVAGTIGAVGNNGVGVAGVNWNAQIMALKFLDAGGRGGGSDAIEALNYAVANGATISNNSWGGGPYSQALHDAIAAARDAGHIFVAAAGNGNWVGIGQDNDARPFYPASYDLDNVVAVAATDHDDQLAVFSNYGATSVELAAPGVDIVSTTPDNHYSSGSGTSMATPHVTGAVALLRDLHPDWPYRQVIDTVLQAVDPVDALQGKTVTGGRLNVAAALAPDVLGPHVVVSSPFDRVSGPVSSLRLVFNEAVDATTFTVDDVVSFTGPAGPIDVSQVSEVAGTYHRKFDVAFPAQSELGDYALVVGPEILDLSGNAMDQDGDGTNGEAADDRYTAVFGLVPFAARYDFGTVGSPVAEGHTQVTRRPRAATTRPWATAGSRGRSTAKSVSPGRT